MTEQDRQAEQGNHPPARVRNLKLSTLLSVGIVTLTVLFTLVTAVAMFKVYDNYLTDEFRQRVMSESDEVSQHMNASLQEVKSQLRLLAMDNSIRVTLMLGVEQQLLERLQVHHQQHRGSVHFIQKAGSDRVIQSLDNPSDKALVEFFLAQENREGQIFMTDDNRLYVGFTTSITRKQERLGLAGSIFELHADQFVFVRNGEDAKLLYVDQQKKLIDIGSRQPVQLNRVIDRGELGVPHKVVVDNTAGFLHSLKHYPNFRYLLSSRQLEKARDEGLLMVFIVSLVAILFSVLLAGRLARKISRPLQRLVKVTQDVASTRGENSSIPSSSHISELHEYSAALLKIVKNLKQAERDKSRAYENLQQVINSMDALVAISDRQSGNILFTNQEAKQTLNSLRVCHNGRQDDRQSDWQEAGPEPAGVGLSAQALPFNPMPLVWEAYDDDALRWYECHSQDIAWFGDEIARMDIVQDITERKLAENELRLSSAIFDTANEAVMILNTNTEVLKINKAFSEISGFVEEEVHGRRADVLSLDQAFLGDKTESLHKHGFWHGEVTFYRKSQQPFPAQVSITTVPGPSGEPKYYAVLFSDITERKRDEEKIRHQANYDTLTGLPNRNLFVDRFGRAIERAQRDKTRIALMFLDLDQFKQVNDTLGHPVGDQLLQEASNRLTAIIRRSDTVARLGGDEFTVLMPDIHELRHVEAVVNNILEVLAKPYRIENSEAFVSASVGVTVYPDDGTEVSDLLRNADSAMYRAKDKGRNNAQFFTLEMNQQATRRRTLDAALRHAMAARELEVHYQPIVIAESGQVRGAEALMRWHARDFGSVSPAEFIPLAEETGLIIPLGSWLMEQACHAAMNWSSIADRPLHIAVNFSSRQFQSGQVVTLIEETLLKTGLPASLLTVEITESLLLGNDKETIKTLTRLRDLGTEIAIDDFGTGYSSLSYLKRFPVTTIKIDRSFVAGLPDNSENMALVKAMLSMARSLNLAVVAEGVENASQYDFLRDEGCEYVQGYYMSKPVAEDSFNALLEDPAQNAAVSMLKKS